MMDDSRINILQNDKISTAIRKMSTPAIIGLLIMALYNFVDAMFVAWISTEATSATQVVFPIMIIASAIGLMFGMGAGAYISRLLGMNDIEKANVVSSTSFFTALVIGILFMILNYAFSTQIYTFFGANEEIMALTKAYGNYIVLGYTFSILNMVFNNQLRAEGSAKISMIGMIIGSVLNIVLDPIFIFDWGLGLGISGAAIATTLSQLVTFAILLYMYLSNKTIIKIKLSQVKLRFEIYKEILKIGVPTLLTQVLMSFSIAFLNTQAMLYGGTDLLAAIGIIIRATMFPVNVVFGLGQGFQPVAGYNFGAKKYDRVIEAFKFTMIASTIVGVVSFLILFLFGEQIFGIFNTTEAATMYGVMGLTYYGLGLILLGASNTIAMFYATIGKGTEALVLSTLRQGLFFIPIILLLPKLYGVEGVLLSQTVADLLTWVVSVALIIPFLKQNKIELIPQS